MEVRPGIYRESLFYGGRRIRVVSTDGPATTIIDATGRGSAAVFLFNEPRLAQLSGFTLRGGTGRNIERPADGREARQTFGGAIVCNPASPTFENLIFVDNQANTGGALYVANGSPLVDSCTFRQNVAGVGGAIAVEFSNLVVRNSIFEDNVSVRGGAIYGWRSGLDGRGSTFRRNSAGEGGAVYMFDNPGHTAILVDCIFFQNRAQFGAALRCAFGNLDFRNCIVSHNGLPELDEVTEVHYTNATGIIRHNVFFSRVETEHLRCENESDVSYSCNVFWPAPVPASCEPGASNLSVDPRFCQPKKGDFRYRADSPLLPENSSTDCGVVGPNRAAECPTLSAVDRRGTEVLRKATDREGSAQAETHLQRLKSYKLEKYGKAVRAAP